MTLASFLAREFVRRNQANQFANPVLAAQNFFVGAASGLDYVDTTKAAHIRRCAVQIETNGMTFVTMLATDTTAWPVVPEIGME